MSPGKKNLNRETFSLNLSARAKFFYFVWKLVKVCAFFSRTCNVFSALQDLNTKVEVV